MTVNLIQLSSVAAQTVNTISIPYVGGQDRADLEDIFYHLGTGLTSQGTYTTPIGGDLDIGIPVGSVASPGNLVNRAAPGSSFSGSAPYEIVFTFNNNFEVDINTLVINGSALQMENFVVEGSTDNVTYEEIGRFSNIPAFVINDYDSFDLPPRGKFYSYIKIRVTSVPVLGAIADVFFFGKLRNAVSGNAGTKRPGDTIGSLIDVDAGTSINNRILRYDASEGAWSARPRFPWIVEREVLTDDLTITTEDMYNPKFIILDPNGATRNVILEPAGPTKDDVVKLKNINGAFDIDVYETTVEDLNVGIIEYWDCNEASGNLSGEVSATVLTEVSSVTSAAGILGTSQALDGSGEWFTSSSSIFDRGQQDFSFSLWVYIQSWASDTGFISKKTGVTDYSFYFDVGVGIRCRIAGEDLIIIPLADMSTATNTWRHLVFTHDVSEKEVTGYWNGVASPVQTYAGTPNNSPSVDFFLGAEGTGVSPNNELFGRVDEFGFWNKPLTAEEASYLYNFGNARAYANLTATPIATLNTAGKLQYEFFYDNTEWLITG